VYILIAPNIFLKIYKVFVRIVFTTNALLTMANRHDIIVKMLIFEPFNRKND